MLSPKTSKIILSYTFPICSPHLSMWSVILSTYFLTDWPRKGHITSVIRKMKKTHHLLLFSFLNPSAVHWMLTNMGTEGSSWDFKHYPALLDASIMLFRYQISPLVGGLLHNLHLNWESIWFHFTEIKTLSHTSQQKLSNPEVPQVSLIHTNLALHYPSFDSSEGKD